MTNILDNVEPTLWGHKAGETLIIADEPHAHLENAALYSRETVERLLAEHRKQVLLEAAEVARSYDDRFGLTGEDDYQCGRMRAAFDIAHELRRMAEGERE